ESSFWLSTYPSAAIIIRRRSAFCIQNTTLSVIMCWLTKQNQNCELGTEKRADNNNIILVRKTKQTASSFKDKSLKFTKQHYVKTPLSYSLHLTYNIYFRLSYPTHISECASD
ncbi:hypothetical protein Tcan_00892, partial [Toxocara canis]